VSVVCLAIGMGASAMSMTLADATVLRPFGLPRAADLVVLWESDPARPQDLIEVSLPTFHDWEREAASFASLAAFGSSHWPGIGRVRGESFSISPRAVSRRFFATLGRPPLVGRDFTADDLSPAHPPPAMLSHAIWVSRFGGASTAIGEFLVIDNELHRIVGVMPPGFAFPASPDVWISVERALARVFERDGVNAAEQRAIGLLQVVGRLEPGRSRQAALSELNAIEQAIGHEFWPTRKPNVAVMTPFTEIVLGKLGARLWIALAMTVSVLLFACANVAALRIADLRDRTGELAARLCLGASRSRLLRQLLREMIPLVAAAALCAIGVALGLEAWLRSVPVVLSSGIDLAEFRDTAALAIASSAVIAWLLVAGGPAVAAVRSMSPALVTLGSRTFVRGSTAGASLLLLQAALAVCVVAMAASAYKVFATLARTDMGFSTAGVTAIDLSVPEWKYPDAASRNALETRLLARMSALPGVTAVAGVSVRPFRFGEIADGLPVRRPEAVATSAAEAIGASRVIVSAEYFDVMGISIEEGRALDEFDRESRQPVVVISRTLARMVWGDESAVGREIEVGNLRGWIRHLVVGVAEDVRSRVLDRPALEVYVPHGRGGLPLSTVVLRHSASVATNDTVLRSALGEVDGDLVLERSLTMRDMVDRVLAPTRLLSTAMTLLGATGLVLLALGIFGAAAAMLRVARREVGIRQAVGAAPLRAARAPLRSLTTALTLGVLAGAVLAPAGVGLLASMGVAERGGVWTAVVVASASVVGAAGVAIGLNLRRATRVPPAELLRCE
jgi:predicted permease